KTAWVSITPLGSPVEPEVYCRTARASRPIRGGDQCSASLSGISDVSSQVRAFSRGVCPVRRWRSRKTFVFVKARVADAFSVTLSRRTSERLARGGESGTAAPPPRQQPNKTAQQYT